jgi:RND superfamily putative drug exporter
VTSDVRTEVDSLGHCPPILARLGTWSFRHRRRAIVAWLLLLIAVTGMARAAGSAFRDDFSGGNPQSQQAQDLLSRTFPADAGDRAEIVFHALRPSTAARHLASRRCCGKHAVWRTSPP